AKEENAEHHNGSARIGSQDSTRRDGSAERIHCWLRQRSTGCFCARHRFHSDRSNSRFDGRTFIRASRNPTYAPVVKRGKTDLGKQRKQYIARFEFHSGDECYKIAGRLQENYFNNLRTPAVL